MLGCHRDLVQLLPCELPIAEGQVYHTYTAYQHSGTTHLKLNLLSPDIRLHILLTILGLSLVDKFLNAICGLLPF